MKEPVVALNIISNVPLKKQTIKKYCNHFDKVYILYNSHTSNLRSIFSKEKLCPNLKVFLVGSKNRDNLWLKIEDTYLPNFSKLRNYLLKKTRADWVMFLDADDYIESMDLDRLIKFIKGCVKETGIKLPYAYDYGINNKINYIHPTLRVWRKGYYDWGKRYVHETLEYIGEGEPYEVYLSDIFVKHTRTEHNQNLRNLLLLKQHFEDTKKRDAVTCFYIGRELLNIDLIKAKEFLLQALKLDLPKSYELLAYQFLADIAFDSYDLLTAVSYIDKILNAEPDYLTGLVLKAKIELLLGNYEIANKLIINILSRLNDTEYIHREQARVTGLNIEVIKNQVLFILAQINIKNKNYDIAYGILRDIWKNIDGRNNYKDGGKEIKELISIVKNKIYVQSKFNKEIIKADKSNNPKDCFSTDVKQTQEYINYIDKKGLRYKRKSSLVIYCPFNFENWDADSIIKSGGGGSETAVVEMAHRLVQDFNEVIVYGNPAVPKTINGVKYLPVDSIDFSDEFDYFISFRDVWIFKDIHIKANKVLLWLQDVAFTHEYTPEVLSKIDKILVLSKYHRSTIAHVPESKIFYTTNGINVDLIKEVEREVRGYKRELNRCLYCSSPDRGLEPLAKFKLEYKYKGRFEWYYGWNSWKTDEESKKWKEYMIQLLKDANILQMGRVGKKELYKAMFTSDLLTYPLIGRAETSCIVAMEAQACGLIPVTTGITALEETQQFGFKIDIDNYAKFLYNLINNNSHSTEKEKYRKEMMEWARNTFSWDNVYKQWKSKGLI